MSTDIHPSLLRAAQLLNQAADLQSVSAIQIVAPAPGLSSRTLAVYLKPLITLAEIARVQEQVEALLCSLDLVVEPAPMFNDILYLMSSERGMPNLGFTVLVDMNGSMFKWPDGSYSSRNPETGDYERHMPVSARPTDGRPWE